MLTEEQRRELYRQVLELALSGKSLYEICFMGLANAATVTRVYKRGYEQHGLVPVAELVAIQKQKKELNTAQARIHALEQEREWAEKERTTALALARTKRALHEQELAMEAEENERINRALVPASKANVLSLYSMSSKLLRDVDPLIDELGAAIQNKVSDLRKQKGTGQLPYAEVREGVELAHRIARLAREVQLTAKMAVDTERILKEEKTENTHHLHLHLDGAMTVEQQEAQLAQAQRNLDRQKRVSQGSNPVVPSTGMPRTIEAKDPYNGDIEGEDPTSLH